MKFRRLCISTTQNGATIDRSHCFTISNPEHVEPRDHQHDDSTVLTLSGLLFRRLSNVILSCVSMFLGPCLTHYYCTTIFISSTLA